MASETAAAEQFRTLVANIPGAVYRCRLDDDYTMVFLSEAIEEITGYPASDFIENAVRSYASIIHPDDADIDQSWENEIRDRRSFDTEYRIVRGDGELRWIWERGRAVFGSDGEVLFVDGVFFDVTDQKRGEEARRVAEEELKRQAALNKHLALHDALTGLPNRTLFHERVAHAVSSRSEDDDGFAVLVLDLDRFKDVNDTLGHHSGDLLLCELADRLRRAVRAHDLVARLGGDEFALLLPACSRDAAAALIGRVKRELEHPFVLHNLPLNVEASIGVAVFPGHGQDVDSLMQRADVAMYAAKDAGEGYAFYDPATDGYTRERLLLVGQLRRAIERGELILHYQPKADLRTGEVASVEALVRWQHPARGLIPPDEFIPVAQETGLIKPLTRYVLAQALAQCRAWDVDGLELAVAVNVSMRNLMDLEFPDEVGELLAESGIAPTRLELEITESNIATDAARTARVLERLSTMGVRIAIDDFGTGYSSLAYLRRLPIDQIKIDRSFVAAMGESEESAVIVRSTIDLGRNLGLQVVAEGVETTEAWNELSRLGCDVAQGFLLSRPVPPLEIRRVLESIERSRPDDSAAAAV